MAVPPRRVLFPGAGVPRRRGGICAPRAAPALDKVACASTSRPRRPSAGGGAVERRRWGPRRRERGRGPPALQPAAPKSWSPQPGRPAEWRTGERGNRFSSTSLPLPHGRRKGEGRAGTPGRPRDWRPPLPTGLWRCVRCPRLALRGVCQPSPGVSARPGRGGRAVRAGCRGRRRAGARGGNPRLVLPLPGSLSLSPRGAGDWQHSPVTHSPRVHIPGEGSRKVINLHQATFPIT